MNENRLNQIDIAKGIGIILVVVGHTTTYLGFEKVIYQFHMPLFFILSGFFFKDKYVKQPLVFLLSRLKRLYIPYVLNGLRLFIVFLVISYLVRENTGFSILGGLYYSLLIILGIGSAPLAGTIWFLRALFFVSFIFIFLKWIISKINCNHNIILFISVLGFLIIGYKTQLPYRVSSSFVALFFYYIGYLYASNMEYVKMNLLFFIIALVVLIYSSIINIVDLAYNTYTSILLFILSSICGTYSVLFVCKKIKQNSFLEFIGKKSLAIMIFHFLSFVPINLMIVFLYNLPLERILDYPTIKEYHWWWILYSVVGVLGPLLIDKIIIDFEKLLPRCFTFTFWFEKLNIYIIK